MIKSSNSAEVDIPDGDVMQLIMAIDNANASIEDDIINLAPDGTYDLLVSNNNSSGPNGLPTILNAATSGSLTINGNGATIQRVAADNVRFRIFNISTSGSLILNDLTVMGGFTPDADGIGFNISGGNGGGINNRGTLVLMNSNVLNNRTGDGFGSFTTMNGSFSGDGGFGGGIFNDAGGFDSGNGILELINSTVSGNITGNGADGTIDISAGRGGFGGGVFNAAFATFSMTGSTVSNNITANGGDGTMTSSDGSGGDGGGIYIGTTGMLEIIGSTISGNRTGNSGVSPGTGSTGGVGAGIFNRTQLTIVNSTISGNITGNGDTTMDAGGGGGNGGGIANISGTFEAIIINTTITDNATGSGSNSLNAINGGNGGGIFNQQNNTTITNTIIAGNSIAPGGRGPNCDNSPIMDGGNNLSDDGNPGATGLGDCFNPMTSSSQTNFNVASFLGPLQNNGGPTQTHSLLDTQNNPAVDGGDSQTCTVTEVDEMDQRAVERFIDDNDCDIGAYEFIDQNNNNIDDCVDTDSFDDVDQDGISDFCDSFVQDQESEQLLSAPTMGQWGMITFSFVAVLFGLRFLRKRSTIQDA